MIKYKIPIVKETEGTYRFDTPSKCVTCAYHVPCTKDEDEMSKMYYAECSLPHPCHERHNGFACFGSMEQFDRLELNYK